MTNRAITATLLLALAATLLPMGVSAAQPTTSTASTASTASTDAQRWIVQLAPGASADGVLASSDRSRSVRPTHVFQRALRGFAARLTPDQRIALLADPRVIAVVPDRPVSATADLAQAVPSGIRRVGARANPDAGPGTLDVDIAVVDTGIQPDHPDLNVAGGYDCTRPSLSEADRQKPANWRDGPSFGHGTHVAGIAAAYDNGQGVVGVAPGARLWSIKVLDDEGNGFWSWIVCGLDRVAAMRDPANAALPRIEVANMSLAGGGWDDGNCGRSNLDLLHQAVCRVTRAGVTIAAAAGNDRDNAAKLIPAAYDEVITVSAMADWNGQAAGTGSPPSGCGSSDADDAFASFSSYGPDVDIIAPGVCVRSTLPVSRYGMFSGTSMATPHVAGGVALFHLWEARAGRGRPTPEQVRAALIAAGTNDWRTGTDRDRGMTGAAREPALQVADLDLSPAFSTGSTPQVLRRLPGGSADYDIWLARLGGFGAPVQFSVVGASLPAGASVAFAPSSLSDPQQAWTTLTVNLPPGSPPGTYDIEVRAASGDALKTTTVRLLLDSPAPIPAGAPRMNLRSGTQTGKVTLPVRVKWDAVSGASRYELQVSRDGGPWSALATTTARRVDANTWPGSFYRYRVRAQQNGVWGSWLVGAASLATPYYAPFEGVNLSGSWSISPIKKAYSELPSYSTQAGARATLDFTGRSVSWISSRSPGRGKARVYIDGALAATVDLYSSSVQHRRVVFSRAWATEGEHRIRIEVLGTANRPRVDVDSIAVVSVR
jgi:subtilisin family serine protease